jgi:hypothetical protein
MKTSLSLLFAAVPFVFALMRALSSGSDLRLLWMALASCIGAAAMWVVTRGRSRTPGVRLGLSCVVLVVATLLAGSAAMLLGAKAAPGIWAVAFVFGVCWAASYAFGAGRATERREPGAEAAN